MVGGRSGIDVLLLGGSGAFGVEIAQALERRDEVASVVVGCRDEARARGALAGCPKCVPRRVALEDEAALAAALADCDVVVNAVGPAYLHGDRVLSAALAAGRAYVDLCDDAGAAAALLELDAAAAAREVVAVVGCGCSPGLTNLVAAAARSHFDDVVAVDVMHASGPGRPLAGPANFLHLCDLVDGDVPIVSGGELVLVPGFAELVPHDFGPPLDVVRCGLIAHPEPLMFRAAFPALERARVLLGFLDEDFALFLARAARLGLTSDEPVAVHGGTCVPRELLASCLWRQFGLGAAAAGDEPALASIDVVVEGVAEGRTRREIHRTHQRIGPMVGVTAATAAVAVASGEVARPGVHTPEACFDPDRFLAAVWSQDVAPFATLVDPSSRGRG